ncbi:DNA repair exonuclease [Corynebacterium sp. HMSC072A04]|uniref:metallophosphoesterase family protein n=1 Tax=Corynebacterium sp. HMSC072A04 TaxID=1715045 RepID=UPI0008BCAD61|nr:DNA repair exonuclease [Corynebacterium sp. HMSC072A04]OFN34725.1 DNA repair exonuclease [Corynebacterium sp. HMSC072A04]
MAAVTFIHTSDFQLGMTRWFLSPAAQSRFDDDREAAVLRLGELATETGAEFIVVAGDVFEHNSLSKSTLLRAKDMFKRLPVPVYLLPGNHDPLVADSIFFNSFADNVHVIADSEPIAVRPGVEIVGAPYLSKRANYDLVRRALEPLPPAEEGAVRIAVGHGQVESRAGEGEDSDADTIDLAFVEECLDKGVIDYLALGDTHSTESLGRSGKVWFSGSPETTAFDDRERDSGNALVVTVEGDRVDVVKHRVGRWDFRAIDADIDSMEDVEGFLEQLDAVPEKIRTAVKYSLRGTVGLSAQARLEQGLAEMEEVFASLKPRERTMDLHLAPSEEELSELSLSGYAANALAELLKDLDNPTARDAANLLFRLSAKGA